VTTGLVEVSNDDERGTVAADLFRLEEGKDRRAGDVPHLFPEESANPQPRF
jgi:hypothetical protein